MGVEIKDIKDCKLSIWKRVSGFRWVGFGLLVRERCAWGTNIQNGMTNG
jgi:hypothetical protein